MGLGALKKIASSVEDDAGLPAQPVHLTTEDQPPVAQGVGASGNSPVKKMGLGAMKKLDAPVEVDAGLPVQPVHLTTVETSVTPPVANENDLEPFRALADAKPNLNDQLKAALANRDWTPTKENDLGAFLALATPGGNPVVGGGSSDDAKAPSPEGPEAPKPEPETPEVSPIVSLLGAAGLPQEDHIKHLREYHQEVEKDVAPRQRSLQRREEEAVGVLRQFEGREAAHGGKGGILSSLASALRVDPRSRAQRNFTQIARERTDFAEEQNERTQHWQNRIFETKMRHYNANTEIVGACAKELSAMADRYNEAFVNSPEASTLKSDLEGYATDKNVDLKTAMAHVASGKATPELATKLAAVTQKVSADPTVVEAAANLADGHEALHATLKRVTDDAETLAHNFPLKFAAEEEQKKLAQGLETALEDGSVPISEEEQEKHQKSLRESGKAIAEAFKKLFDKITAALGGGGPKI